ncbi:15727_t:CDS:2, partial [Dentiscutata erythropus]
MFYRKTFRLEFWLSPILNTGLYLSRACIPLSINVSRFGYIEYGNGICVGVETSCKERSTKYITNCVQNLGLLLVIGCAMSSC